MQPLAPGSDSRGLLDAVEADTGGGGRDGHGPCHTGTDGVLVLPPVPALPHGRSHLGGISEGYWSSHRGCAEAPAILLLTHPAKNGLLICDLLTKQINAG